MAYCGDCKRVIRSGMGGNHGVGICVDMFPPIPVSDRRTYGRALSNADDLNPSELATHMLTDLGSHRGLDSPELTLKAAQVLATLAVADSLRDIADALTDANKI
jgi:hypothetical protein